MKLIPILIGLSVALVPAAFASEECKAGRLISGRIEHVRDAHTIQVGGVPIRLQGIVAPNLSEPNGVDASVVVSLLSSSMIGPAICYLTGSRTRDRCVAQCVISVDLAKSMVNLGGGSRLSDVQRWQIR